MRDRPLPLPGQVRRLRLAPHPGHPSSRQANEADQCCLCQLRHKVGCTFLPSLWAMFLASLSSRVSLLCRAMIRVFLHRSRTVHHVFRKIVRT